MKKILFFLSLAVVVLGVSACTTSQPVDNQPADQFNTSVPATNQSAVNNSADQTNASAPATPVEDKTIMPSPEQQKSLTKEYSQALIKTNYGDIKVKFYGSDAPLTVNNFLNLAQADFYNGTKFHRVIKGFMIQGGDPLSKGTDTAVYGSGGPGYQFKDEYNNYPLDAGTLAMANAGPDTNGSQFFIVTSPTELHLQGHYTIFGKVVSGLDIVTKIENVSVLPNPGNPDEISLPAENVIINSVDLLK